MLNIKYFGLSIIPHIYSKQADWYSLIRPSALQGAASGV